MYRFFFYIFSSSLAQCKFRCLSTLHRSRCNGFAVQMNSSKTSCNKHNKLTFLTSFFSFSALFLCPRYVILSFDRIVLGVSFTNIYVIWDDANVFSCGVFHYFQLHNACNVFEVSAQCWNIKGIELFVQDLQYIVNYTIYYICSLQIVFLFP